MTSQARTNYKMIGMGFTLLGQIIFLKTLFVREGSIPKWPLLTKMTVILHQNDRYFLPKWPLLYQNDRYKLHQNDRYFYQNDRYLGPKWPLPKWPLWTKMTVIYKHQNDRYFVLKWPLCEQNNRYLDQKWSFCLTVILVLNNGHFGP